MRRLIVVAALALPLAGCFQNDDDFARCERNGLKIGSAEFETCERTLLLRAIAAAETKRLVAEDKRIKAEEKRTKSEVSKPNEVSGDLKWR